MEFREFYRGVCAKIRFDYAARTYHAVLEGLPGPSSIQSSSYDELQRVFRETVDNELSSASGVDDVFPDAPTPGAEPTGRAEPGNDGDSTDEPYARRKFLR